MYVLCVSLMIYANCLPLYIPKVYSYFSWFSDYCCYTVFIYLLFQSSPSSNSDTSQPSSSKKSNKGHYIGLLKIWASMQKTICGHDTNIPKDKWENDIHNMNLGNFLLSF